MRLQIKQTCLFLTLNLVLGISTYAQQWSTDPANTNDIYNTNLMNGKVGIGMIPEVDGPPGQYQTLTPLFQIRGKSGTTGGSAQLPLPVLKISSPINSNSIGFGLSNYSYPFIPQSFIYTEGRLQINSTTLEILGTSLFRQKVILANSSFTTGIGQVEIPTPGNYRLYVTGGILTEKIKVALSSDAVNWSDFVFAKDYKLRSLSEVESYVTKHHHLPEIPSSEEVYKDGLDLAQMDAKLLMKIEELTLYMIEMKKENELLRKEVTEIKNSITK